MKRYSSTIDRRCTALGVGLAALLLVPGCGLLHPPSFHKATNPRVCPVCVASTPQQCSCFPSDIAAGYSETRWGRLASFDAGSSPIVSDGLELPLPRLFQVEHQPIEAITGGVVEQPVVPEAKPAPPEENIKPPTARQNRASEPPPPTDEQPKGEGTKLNEGTLELHSGTGALQGDVSELHGDASGLSGDRTERRDESVELAVATVELRDEPEELAKVTPELREAVPKLQGALPDGSDDFSLPPVLVAELPDYFYD